ncbi:MAG: hypothetical protein IEMM0008_0080 [bacterium]|nr:MAG: hypothetical protein IEMM0008_0080 [bacterium]
MRTLHSFILFLALSILSVSLLSCKRVVPSQKDEAKNTSESTDKKTKPTFLAHPTVPDKIYILKRLANGKVIKEETSSQNVIVKINQIVSDGLPKIQLFVSVTNRKGQPLEIADPNVFFLEENEQPVPRINIISIVQKKNTNFQMPLNTVLAIDKSGSMAFDGSDRVTDEANQPLTFAKKAALDFIRNIKTIDNVRVIAFDHNLHDLGRGVQSVEAIKNLKPSGDTALYGALYKSVKLLQSERGLKTVILLTDGKNDLRNTFSRDLKNITLDAGLKLAQDLSIPVFTIGFGMAADTKILKKIAHETHSLYFSTQNKTEFSQLYGKIKHIINNQYIITYKSTHYTAKTYVKVLVFSDSDVRAYINPDDLLAKASKLEARLKALEKREKEVARLKILYEEQIALYKNKLAELKEGEANFKKRFANLGQSEREFIQNQARMKALKEKIEGLNDELNRRKKEVDAAITRLREKERSLLTKDKKIVAETKRLDRQEILLKRKAILLTKSQKNISIKEISLEQEKFNLSNESSRLTTLKSDLNMERLALKTQLASLNNIRIAISLKEKSFKRQKAELDRLKAEYEVKRVRLANEQSQFKIEKAEVIKLRARIAREQKQVRRLKSLLGEFVSDTSQNLEDIEEKQLTQPKAGQKDKIESSK